MRKRKTEETLQSIFNALKRFEKILIDQTRQTEMSIDIANGNTDDLIKKYIEKRKINY